MPPYTPTPFEVMRSCFSAPKGVERACPRSSNTRHTLTLCFSAPKGVERACPVEVARRGGNYTMFQCPEGR